MQQHANTQDDLAAQVTPRIRPRAPWRVADLEVLPRFCLRVRFNDGTEGSVDMRAFIHSLAAGPFAALREENRFREARIVLGAVTWPDDLDLAPDAMHHAIREHGAWIVT
ncbi:MAG TPA: DUF2442 domain-containing protein [Rhizomicrobium sp.]|jgi:hypothetical protein|nr:DUF2442 domain-containing protein [Rhizomicrobium sp.]